MSDLTLSQKIEAKEGGIIHDIIQQITVFFGADAQEAQRNRESMLALMERIWIDDVLNNSLHDQAALELRVRQSDQVVERSWETLRQFKPAPHPSPPSFSIVEAFDRAAGQLLILGEAGSGKTTLLLQLTREMLTRARMNSQPRIPAFFDLSSWAKRRAAFETWLVEELTTRYYIPRKTAQTWIEKDELLLLLDGLDEVHAEHRAKCVQAINLFRHKHGLAPMVICCRTSDYAVLASRLELQGAVLVEPLSLEQIYQRLANSADEHPAIQKLLREDPVFFEMARNPLHLEILAQTYREVDWTKLNASAPTVDAYQARLFQTYVQTMSARPRVGSAKKALPPQTFETLGWLARKMSEHAQTLFYIEQLQPDWLTDSRHHFVYAAMTRALIGAIIGLACGLTFVLNGQLNLALSFGLIVTLAALAASWLATRLPNWCAIAFATGATIFFASWVSANPMIGLPVGIFFGVPAGLAGVSVAARQIKMVERLRWSWRGSLYFCLTLASITLITGLALAFGGEFDRAVLEFAQIILLMIVIALLVALAFFLAFGRSRQIDVVITPNQGFKRSLQNALQGGLTFLGAVALLGAIMIALESKSAADPDALGKGVMFIGLASLIVIPPLVLYVGGAACIQHLILRWILAATRALPLNLTEFLEHATERIILRKAGSGYKFYHRQLLDYFARL